MATITPNKQLLSATLLLLGTRGDRRYLEHPSRLEALSVETLASIYQHLPHTISAFCLNLLLSRVEKPEHPFVPIRLHLRRLACACHYWSCSSGRRLGRNLYGQVCHNTQITMLWRIRIGWMGRLLWWDLQPDTAAGPALLHSIKFFLVRPWLTRRDFEQESAWRTLVRPSAHNCGWLRSENQIRMPQLSFRMQGSHLARPSSDT